MRYICTFPHKRILVRLFSAAALTALSLPPSAQNAQNTHLTGKTAQAELHIQVVVVPVIIPRRHHKEEGHDYDAVTYSLRPQSQLSVTEETHPMLLNAGSKEARQELVRVTTVVAK